MSANKILLSLMLVVSAGCGTTGMMAPIEDRGTQNVKPAPPPVKNVQPKPEVSPKPAAADDAPHVFALPDAANASPHPVPDTGAVPTPIAAPVLPPPADPAVRELLAKSAQAQASGDTAAARAIVERALKVKPDDPRAWYQLAEINFASGDFEQSIVTAQRARSLAGKDDALKLLTNQLIDKAQQALQRH